MNEDDAQDAHLSGAVEVGISDLEEKDTDKPGQAVDASINLSDATRRHYQMTAEDLRAQRANAAAIEAELEELRRQDRQRSVGESTSPLETAKEIGDRDARSYAAILAEEKGMLVANRGVRAAANKILSRLGFGKPFRKPGAGEHEAEWNTYNTVNRGLAPYISYQDFIAKGYQDRRKWAPKY